VIGAVEIEDAADCVAGVVIFAGSMIGDLNVEGHGGGLTDFVIGEVDLR
tara:strand:- start:593 stop:739 length:147 start_codon:yes stop_codon:yes gene_type:complete